MSDYKTEPYTPTTEEIRNAFVQTSVWLPGTPFSKYGEFFDRWYVQEIEKAEYSGYLRAVREGLHR